MATDRSESTEDAAQKPAKKNAENKDVESKAEKRAARREIALAIIQHGNRSVVILAIFIVVFIGIVVAHEPLYNWLLKAESIKIGSFEYKVREQVASARLQGELSKLSELSDEQIQLFLIVGRARKTKAAGDMNIRYHGEEVTLENLNKLQAIGLLTDVGVGGDGFKWIVTATGERLHDILFREITRSLRSAPVD